MPQGQTLLVHDPARLVRIVAQPIFHATVFELERLRCALCGALFTAPAPPEAGLNKYDPSVGNMLALMRYGAGLPMYRTGKWQNHFGVPLPASTQWELIEAASEYRRSSTRSSSASPPKASFCTMMTPTCASKVCARRSPRLAANRNAPASSHQHHLQGGPTPDRFILHRPEACRRES